jgi:integral membrane protein
MTSKFRTVALLEAISYLALLVATFVKRVIEGPDLVPVLGPIHGILFLAYVLLTLLVREEQGWTLGQTLIVLVASTIPFGAFVVNSRMVHDPAPSAAT